MTRLDGSLPGWTRSSLGSVSCGGCRRSEQVVPLPPGQHEVIALDGKAVRRSHDRGAGKNAMHMVSAWATTQRLVLAQTQVDEKSNEITALPLLLQQLALSGCIVTIDAMGCPTAIARQSVEQGGDYVLALKGNQGTLAEDVALLFSDGRATPFAGMAHDTQVTTEKDHGRLEIRRHWTLYDPASLAHLNPQGKWTGLRAVGLGGGRTARGDPGEHHVPRLSAESPADGAGLWRSRPLPLGHRNARALDP